MESDRCKKIGRGQCKNGQKRSHLTRNDPPSKARERLPITDSVGQHRSDYQLSVTGALRQSTGVVSDSFFESDRTASGASYTTKSS